MRAIIFTSKNHMLANAIIKELLINPQLEVSMIIESEALYPGKKRLQALIYFLQTAGFQYTFFQIIKFVYFGIIKKLYIFYPYKNEKHIFFPFEILSKKKHIQIMSTENINSKTFINKLKKENPDLFISIFMNQIFKEELISIPKKGTLNIHPSFLPSYRGLSPTFWSMSNNEKKVGITIHEINDASIDKGRIIYQKEIPISKSISEYRLYWKCILEGIPLLKKTVDDISNGRLQYKKAKKNVKESYFSIPTKKAFKKFKQNKRRFVYLNELFFSSYENFTNPKL